MIGEARRTIEAASVLLMQLEVPFPSVEEAARIAAENGAAVIFNPAPAPAFPLPASFLERIGVLIANEEEMAALSQAFSGARKVEAAAAQLLQEGVGTVIVTQGPRGGLVFGRDGKAWRFEGKKVKAVDAVGAGDCFCGWVAAGLARGDDLRTSVERAARAAALSVTRKGAQPSLPGRDEVSD
jgi:ribokinase